MARAVSNGRPCAAWPPRPPGREAPRRPRRPASGPVRGTAGQQVIRPTPARDVTSDRRDGPGTEPVGPAVAGRSRRGGSSGWDALSRAARRGVLKGPARVVAGLGNIPATTVVTLATTGRPPRSGRAVQRLGVPAHVGPGPRGRGRRPQGRRPGRCRPGARPAELPVARRVEAGGVLDERDPESGGHPARLGRTLGDWWADPARSDSPPSSWRAVRGAASTVPTRRAVELGGRSLLETLDRGASTPARSWWSATRSGPPAGDVPRRTRGTAAGGGTADRARRPRPAAAHGRGARRWTCPGHALDLPALHAAAVGHDGAFLTDAAGAGSSPAWSTTGRLDAVRPGPRGQHGMPIHRLLSSSTSSRCLPRGDGAATSTPGLTCDLADEG